MKWFMKFISDKFDVKKSETGPLEWILGGRVTRNISRGTTSIDQSIAIEKLATKLGLQHSNPVRSPMSATPLPMAAAPMVARAVQQEGTSMQVADER